MFWKIPTILNNQHQCYNKHFVGLNLTSLFVRKRLYFHVIADSEQMFKRLVNSTSDWPTSYKNKIIFKKHDVWYPEVSSYFILNVINFILMWHVHVQFFIIISRGILNGIPSSFLPAVIKRIKPFICLKRPFISLSTLLVVVSWIPTLAVSCIPKFKMVK